MLPAPEEPETSLASQHAITIADTKTRLTPNPAIAASEIFIYSVLCKNTQKRYIGQTKNLEERIKRHKTNPQKKKTADVNRYQPFKENFKVTVLDAFDDQDKAKTAEAFYIQQFKATKEGYNNLKGAPSTQQKYYYLKHKSKLT